MFSLLIAEVVTVEMGMGIAEVVTTKRIWHNLKKSVLNMKRKSGRLVLNVNVPSKTWSSPHVRQR